ncbi:hypothetical protein GF345_01520 [Candidatus Woesearchaeota archaeon]|nr:hypothetical protein [Candidatus Woesearchaeota archaeon]
MQNRVRTENVSKVRNILIKYKRDDIEYNESHFTLKLERQKIDRKEVVKNILNPDKLVLVGVSESKNPGYRDVHDLYFKLSRNRIFKIPVSIKPKSLYLITIFKIRKRIQDEAAKYYRK